MVSNRKEKYFIHYSIEIFYTYEFVRTVSGSIESIFFSVYLDGLSLELSTYSVKAGCYIGEVLLTHLVFAECFVQVYLGCKVY